MKRSTLIISIFSFLVILSLSLSAQATAPKITKSTKPLQTITLTDGTQLKGYLIGVEEDTYLIETLHLGQIKLRVSEIQSITTTGAQPMPQAYSAPMAGQPLSMLNTLGLDPQVLNDPEITAGIQELLSDPKVMDLLSDMMVQDDILSMNPARFQNNESIQELIQHPKMQEFIQTLGAKMNR